MIMAPSVQLFSLRVQVFLPEVGYAFGKNILMVLKYIQLKIIA